MTTTSVLLTVNTTWSATSDKCDKEETVIKCGRDLVALAARELRETPTTREQALRLMKEWIAKNPDVINVRTGLFNF